MAGFVKFVVFEKQKAGHLDRQCFVWGWNRDNE